MSVDETEFAFPFRPEVPGEPPGEFAVLRARRRPTRVRMPTGAPAWLVTGYADVRTVLTDPRLSRAAATAPGAPRLGPVRPDRRSMMAMDAPAHTRLRRMVTGAFTAGTVAAMHERVSAAADRSLDAMSRQGPPADLAGLFSRPMAMSVICDLIGVPEADRAAFAEWSDQALLIGPGSGADVEAGRAMLRGYLTELVAAKQRERGDDLLCRLASRAVTAGHGEPAAQSPAPTPLEVVDIGVTVLSAGYHTVANTLTTAVLVLLRHPEAFRSLVRDPALVPDAVEELLRYTPGPIGGGTIRVATEDLEIGGVRIAAGDAVLPATTSANRDANVFADPDTLDLRRTDNRHLAFGAGIHRCLGAHLARLELRVALEALVRRFPGLRPAVPLDDVAWRTETILGGVRELRLVW